VLISMGVWSAVQYVEGGRRCIIATTKIRGTEVIGSVESIVMVSKLNYTRVTMVVTMATCD
jgi:hypothetical protein